MREMLALDQPREWTRSNRTLQRLSTYQVSAAIRPPATPFNVQTQSKENFSNELFKKLSVIGKLSEIQHGAR